jgi:ferric-dicitrate binding protein FerR (iron transport regulator)
MKYEYYQASDFFQDENFRNWILKNDPDLNLFWERWLLQHPHKRNEIQVARKMVLALQFKDEQLTEEQSQGIWAKIISENEHQEMDSKPASKILPIDPSKSRNLNTRTFSWFFYRIAAGFSLLAIVWFMLENPHSVETELVEIQPVIKENPAGQKSKIFLSDGSVVYLNANSRIRYLEDFQNDKRLIHLEGEAFFEVAKDSLRPFIVNSGAISTRALGTKFNVAAFPEQEEIQVTLLEGKVELVSNDSSTQLILEEKEAALYDPNSIQLTELPYDANHLLWKDGILYFNQSLLPEVISSLERWYGVQVEINGNFVPNTMISGRFENESLENVLQSIGFTSGFKYTIEGKNVELYLK